MAKTVRTTRLWSRPRVRQKFRDLPTGFDPRFRGKTCTVHEATFSGRGFDSPHLHHLDSLGDLGVRALHRTYMVATLVASWLLWSPGVSRAACYHAPTHYGLTADAVCAGSWAQMGDIYDSRVWLQCFNSQGTLVFSSLVPPSVFVNDWAHPVALEMAPCRGFFQTSGKQVIFPLAERRLSPVYTSKILNWGDIYLAPAKS